MVRLACLVPLALVPALAGAGALAVDDDEACEQHGGECGAAAMRVELLQSGAVRADAGLVSGRRGAGVSAAAPPVWAGWGTKFPEPEMSASRASRQAATDAVLRPTDVVVITFPKTGTTWLQQICEQLRTRGNMEFMEITERQPWLDLAYDCGVDMDADQHAEPRVFKSHQLLSAVSTGAKYISIVRDPKDLLPSIFSFERAKGISPFSHFDDVNAYYATGHFEIANVWEFYTDLWRARDDPNVLVQSYEELGKDVAAYLPRIGEFLGVAMDANLVQVVLDMSTKQFMLDHATQFDDNYIMNECSNGPMGGNRNASAEKVTMNQTKQSLTSATITGMQAVWDARVRPRTGMKTYDDMSTALAALARGAQP